MMVLVYILKRRVENEMKQILIHSDGFLFAAHAVVDDLKLEGCSV